MRVAVAICALVAFANALVGPAGIVSPDGKNIQFSHAFADDIALIGSGGIVTKSGTQNLQLTAAQASLHAPVPVAHFVAGNAGPSGIVRPDGNNRQFTHAEAHDIVLVGPSGAVTRSGNNLQFRKKRSAASEHLIGDSGLITKNGQQVQFTHGPAQILLEGPAGIILTNGQLVQKRAKRSAGGHLIGDSGLITKNGQQVQFTHGPAQILLEGPAGIILTNGQLVQKRAKRSVGGHVLGDSGLITADGQQFQFTEGGVHIVLDGPSGLLLSDGTQIQKKA